MGDLNIPLLPFSLRKSTFPSLSTTFCLELLPESVLTLSDLTADAVPPVILPLLSLLMFCALMNTIRCVPSGKLLVRQHLQRVPFPSCHHT